MKQNSIPFPNRYLNLAEQMSVPAVPLQMKPLMKLSLFFYKKKTNVDDIKMPKGISRGKAKAD